MVQLKKTTIERLKEQRDKLAARIQAAEVRAQQSERKRLAHCLGQNIIDVLDERDLFFLKQLLQKKQYLT